MKIISIKIENNKVIITLDSTSSAKKVYVDTLDNDKNKYSLEDDAHSYVVTSIQNTGTEISFDIIPELDLSAFTVTIDGILGFYYDDKELYYKQIDLLTNYCSTCLDKEQKENMVMFDLRYGLLEYALKNNLIEDAIQHYKDISRMLNIDTTKNTNGMCSGKCKYGSSVCKDGVCSLC